MTNSQLCDFGDQFRLVFTPDMKLYDSSNPAYKLSDSNPGQFFYNVFYEGVAGETITIEIPYPFVTQGANPVHIYGGVSVDPVNSDLATPDNLVNCFNPVEGNAYPIELITLETYNGESNDTTTVQVTLPESGFVYMNIHLDYGLEKTNGCLKSGRNANDNTNLDPDRPAILDNTPNTFSASVADNTDTVSNLNEFKRVKRFGGLVYLQTRIDEDGQPVYGGLESAQVQLIGPDGNTFETMTTDADGWYLSGYIHKGKAAAYTLRLVGTGDYPEQEKEVLVGGKVKFGEGSFSIPTLP